MDREGYMFPFYFNPNDIQMNRLPIFLLPTGLEVKRVDSVKFHFWLIQLIN